MLKQIIAILVLSVVIIVGMEYAQQTLQLLVSAHDWVADFLKDVFSGGQAGNIIRQLIALLAIPIVVALIPTIIYWIAKRSWFPYFMEVLWIVWLVQTSALVIVNKAAA